MQANPIKEMLEFCFHAIFWSLAIVQIATIKSLIGIGTQAVIMYGGMTIMGIIFLIMPAVIRHLHPQVLNMITMIILIVQVFDWNEIPYLALVFTTGLGIILYPLFLNLLKNGTLSASGLEIPRLRGSVFGVPVGFLIARMILLGKALVFMAFIDLVPILAILGTIMIGVMIWRQPDFIFPFHKKGNQQSPISLVNILLLGAVLGIETGFLNTWAITPAFPSILVNIVIDFAVIGLALILHLFINANRLWGWAWWILISFILLFTSTVNWVVWLGYLLYDFLIINLFLVLFEDIPPIEISIIPKKILSFVNWLALLAGLAFLVGGLFLFPDSGTDLRIKVGVLAIIGICFMFVSWRKKKMTEKPFDYQNVEEGTEFLLQRDETRELKFHEKGGDDQ